MTMSSTYQTPGFYFEDTWDRMAKKIMDKIEQTEADKITLASIGTFASVQYLITNKDNLNWKYISMNPYSSMEMILEHPELPWDKFRVAYNPNITIEWFKKIADESTEGELRDIVTGLSRNASLTDEFLEECPTLPWNMSDIRKYCPLVSDSIKNYVESPRDSGLHKTDLHITNLIRPNMMSQKQKDNIITMRDELHTYGEYKKRPISLFGKLGERIHNENVNRMNPFNGCITKDEPIFRVERGQWVLNGYNSEDEDAAMN